MLVGYMRVSYADARCPSIAAQRDLSFCPNGRLGGIENYHALARGHLESSVLALRKDERERA